MLFVEESWIILGFKISIENTSKVCFTPHYRASEVADNRPSELQQSVTQESVTQESDLQQSQDARQKIGNELLYGQCFERRGRNIGRRQ